MLINFFIFLTALFCFSGLALDVGMVELRRLQLQHAADAAAQYGAISGNSSNFATMQTIATNSAKGISGFSATASKWCACSPGGAAVACASTCPGYGSPVAYVQVVTTATTSVLFKFTGIPVSIPLRGVCVLRVQ